MCPTPADVTPRTLQTPLQPSAHSRPLRPSRGAPVLGSPFGFAHLCRFRPTRLSRAPPERPAPLLLRTVDPLSFSTQVPRPLLLPCTRPAAGPSAQPRAGPRRASTWEPGPSALRGPRVPEHPLGSANTLRLSPSPHSGHPGALQPANRLWPPSHPLPSHRPFGKPPVHSCFTLIPKVRTEAFVCTYAQKCPAIIPNLTLS